jgi:hypothetical protein
VLHFAATAASLVDGPLRAQLDQLTERPLLFLRGWIGTAPRDESRVFQLSRSLMSFIIKAVDGERVSYIGNANRARFRSLVDRAEASVFETVEEARLAIASLPDVFTQAGLRFSVECELPPWERRSPHTGPPQDWAG